MKAPKATPDPFERALELQRRGQTQAAESAFRKLVSRSAAHHRALAALGILLFETGRVDEATRYLERAVQLEPRPEYLTNLGEIQRRAGRLDLAAERFGQILELDPDYPEARVNLAVTLAEAGVQKEALELLEQALARGPDGPRLRVALASLLLRGHRPDLAVVHARRAVELSPASAGAERQLADTLDALGEKDSALASYRRAVELAPADHAAHSDLIVAMLASPAFDARAHHAEARAWAVRHAAPLERYVRPHTNQRDPERPLRIGYVSADFRAHAMHQFLAPLFQNHDRSSFESFLYSSVARPDVQTAWYRDFAGERFRDVRRIDDVALAEIVRADGIDILVDLALHSQGGRLRTFACRPAPVQMSWLGYLGTTGLDTVDYRITDPFIDPPGSDTSVYSETCLRLPETLWCYSSLGSDLELAGLPALATGAVTFGCQNTYRKQHPGVFALFARVLCEVPAARLFLHAEEYARPGVRAVFARAGVDVERLEFGGRVSHPEYLRRYRRIDIGLDTFPFNGATTTLDAAWMGVPVVSLSGPSALQRAAACINHHLGVPELAAGTEDEFVATAVALAGDLPRLHALRQELRTRLETSPLGDAPRFVRHLEAAYRSAWRRYVANP